MSSTHAGLHRERRDRVLVLRLDRPEAANALDGPLIAALADALVEAETSPEIAAVVLTGTGTRTFCSGLDLRAFAADGTSPADSGHMETYTRLLHGEVGIPLVGGANGTALAGGFELLMGCDVIVASSTASFGLPEVKRGLFSAGNGTSISNRIPLGVALEMGLTGDPISADRAHELGIVNAVVDPGEVLEGALGYAERIAANAPLSLAATKELLRLAVTDPARVAERRREWTSVVFSSEDAREGATAFAEKRRPVWRGR